MRQNTQKCRGEELPHVQGAVAAQAQGMERSYSTFKVRRDGRERYPSSKVRKSSCALQSSPEEIPHVQGKRNPSKTVSVARGHQRADTLKP